MQTSAAASEDVTGSDAERAPNVRNELHRARPWSGLLQALHESRLKAAARELRRYRHLNQDGDASLSALRDGAEPAPDAFKSALPAMLTRLLVPILLVGFAAAHVIAAYRIGTAHRLVQSAPSNELIIPAGD
jgi:hypothetical protein